MKGFACDYCKREFDQYQHPARGHKGQYCTTFCRAKAEPDYQKIELERRQIENYRARGIKV